MSTVLIFLLVIVVLVVIHELGHFFAAKAFNIRVDEFGVGYPPRAGSLFTWKGTRFTLNWLPFGGFVKIFGEDSVELGDQATAFAYQKLWKRLIVIIAGVVANIVLAVVLYALSFSIGFLGTSDEFPSARVISAPEVLITDVVKDSPASMAGIMPGDRVVSIGHVGEIVVPKSATAFTELIRSVGEREMTLVVKRGKGTETLTVIPRVGDDKFSSIGVGITEAGTIRLPVIQSIKLAIKATLHDFVATIVGVGKLIGSAISGGGGVMEQVSGPIGIARFAGVAYGIGIGTLLSFAALISVNLAVINLLPFPALDGGRFVLEFFSSGGSSRVPRRVVGAINQIGFILLIVLMLVITYNDIARLVT